MKTCDAAPWRTVRSYVIGNDAEASLPVGFGYVPPRSPPAGPLGTPPPATACQVPSSRRNFVPSRVPEPSELGNTLPTASKVPSVLSAPAAERYRYVSEEFPK